MARLWLYCSNVALPNTKYFTFTAEKLSEFIAKTYLMYKNRKLIAGKVHTYVLSEVYDLGLIAFNINKLLYSCHACNVTCLRDVNFCSVSNVVSLLCIVIIAKILCCYIHILLDHDKSSRAFLRVYFLVEPSFSQRSALALYLAHSLLQYLEHEMLKHRK